MDVLYNFVLPTMDPTSAMVGEQIVLSARLGFDWKNRCVGKWIDRVLVVC